MQFFAGQNPIPVSYGSVDSVVVVHAEDPPLEPIADQPKEDVVDVIVLAADDALYKHYLSPTGHDTTDYHYAVSGVMHSVAKRLTAYNWGYSYPLVIAKPDDQPKEDVTAVIEVPTEESD